MNTTTNSGLFESAELLSFPCLFMRGGSSRGAFIRRSHLPDDISQRDAVLLAAYGSPDSRQVDGIGGADPLTSKAALVELSEREDADVEYTFCQVGIDQPVISTGGNCGNMLAGVGPFAIMTGLVEPREPFTKVRIFVTNISQVIIATVPVKDGMPLVEGNCVIAGVPDAGAKIMLDFGDCAGSISGHLLPTGAVTTTIDLVDDRAEVSLIDAATPFVFVSAKHIGVTGAELPDAILGNPALMKKLEAARSWAAVQLGLVASAAQATELSPNIPRVMMVTAPQDYETISGQLIRKGDVDIVVRQMAMQRPHRALAVTGAVCAAVGSTVEGSLLWKIAGSADGNLRIGHPAGVLHVRASTKRNAAGELRVTSAVIERTARLIMSGGLYVRRSKVDAIVRAKAFEAPKGKESARIDL
jgi:2-methylaconitate cis-trans-isomerase PrpF